MLVEIARAKINLTLKVLGRRPDGFHELASLVAFADFGDRLALTPSDRWSLQCAGPMADGITGSNLVDRAAHAVAAVWPKASTGQVDLDKQLPVAAGIGGGSADAAACLRLLAKLNQDRDGAPDWMRLARTIGADVPVCLINRLAFMQGIGERVKPLGLAARIPAVLVNPHTQIGRAHV